MVRESLERSIGEILPIRTLTIPHATFLAPTDGTAMNDLTSIAYFLLEKGIPVVLRDEGETICGIVSTPSHWQIVRATFPNAVCGYSKVINPFCFSLDGLVVNFGTLATIAAYRARNQPPGIFGIDDGGDIIGEKGAKLRTVSDEELLYEISEGRESGNDLAKLIEATRKNWPDLSLPVRSDCYCLKIDVNDSSRLKNIGDLTPQMTGFFYRLTEIIIELGVHPGEITGESILCYPETIEQIRLIKEVIEWLLMQQQYSWSLKSVLIGPKKIRELYKAPSGVYPFVLPPTPLEIITQTEKRAKENGRITYGAYPL